MRLQGSQTRSGPVGLGGDFSRVKRESAGYGRKRKGSREGGRPAAASKQAQWHRQRRSGLTSERGQGKAKLKGELARVQRERGEGSCVRAALVEDGGGGWMGVDSSGNVRRKL